MGDKTDVWQGTLTLIVLKTLEAMGPLTAIRARFFSLAKESG